VSGRPVDLSSVREDLARLVELARAGVDVHGLLAAEEETLSEPMKSTSIRIDERDLALADEVAELLAGSHMAKALGSRWGRSAVLRLAVVTGLEVLRKRHEEDK